MFRVPDCLFRRKKVHARYRRSSFTRIHTAIEISATNASIVTHDTVSECLLDILCCTSDFVPECISLNIVDCSYRLQLSNTKDIIHENCISITLYWPLRIWYNNIFMTSRYNVQCVTLYTRESTYICHIRSKALTVIRDVRSEYM